MRALPHAADEAASDRIASVVRDVLTRSEFHPSAVERAWERLMDEVAGWFDGAAIDGVGWVTAAIGAAILVGLALFLVYLAAGAARRRQRAPLPDGTLPREQRVADLRRRARDAERRGELVLALRLYFFALVVGLGEVGVLEYRDAWTNRELLERGRPSSAVRARLAPLVQALDRKSFGGDEVSLEDVRDLERIGRELVVGGS